MLIIDGHEDIGWNAVELGRDVTRPLAALRAAEGAHPVHGEGIATVTLPALRAGGVQVVFATIFTYPYGSSSSSRPGYRTPDEAFTRAWAQVEYYRGLEAAGQVTLIRTRDDLEGVLAGDRPLPGLVLLMEGADPIRTPADLAQFAAHGLRFVGLSWKATRHAGGTGKPGPLTDDGRALLEAMAAQGITLDISHLAEEAFWQAVKVYPGRIIASHGNSRALVPTDRQLSDDMLRVIADRDGVVGLVLFNKFIQAGWVAGDGKDAVSLRDLLPHVEHIARTIGTAHLGLGSDLDGGLGRELVPHEIDSVADLGRFADTLAAAGYPAPSIAGIMGENWLRVLREIYQ